MKTLHLTNSWHQTSGGIATFYRALMDEANRQGHEICLLVPGPEDRLERVGEFGRIYHVQAPSSLLNKSYRTIYPSQFLRPGGKLQRILSAERPDLVEICDKYTLNYLGAILRRRLLPGPDFRPVVVGLSCERMDDNFRSYIGSFPLAQTFCSVYMRWLYFPFFDHHIANSDYTAAELRTAAQGHLTPRATWVRHMGVDLSHFAPQRKSSEVRRRLLQNFGANTDAVLLFYAGRLVPEKNLQLLFDLLEHLSRSSHRDCRLIVVGDGIERPRWEAESSTRSPGRALFLGHLHDRTVLADLFANCDFFVHPNPCEPFGIAPLEAMASGLPLIAPDRGGVTSYANSDNAWTVPADVQSFAAALEAALEQPRVTKEKARKALEVAQAYRWETVTSSFIDLYHQLHRLQTGHADRLPAASFSSTPATRLQSWLFRGVSQSVERVFSAICRLLSKSPHRGKPNPLRPGPASTRHIS
jgi:alpha-1,6-mannosyltransferase